MRLYKYLHPARIDVLNNGKVRFTQPADLNDPFELSPALDEIINDNVINQLVELVLHLATADEEEALKTYQQLSGYAPLFVSFGIDALNLMRFEQARQIARQQTPDFIRSFFTQAIDDIRNRYPELRNHLHNRFGILSLSKRNDSLLMWSHYADSHTGFVLEVDSDHPTLDQRHKYFDVIGFPQEVIYSIDRPKLSIINLEEEAGKAMMELARNFFLTKSDDWHYEDEWRIIMPVSEKIHLFSFPPECIKGVILGSRMSDERKREIIKALSSDHFSHVCLQQAVIDPRHFRVNIVNL